MLWRVRATLPDRPGSLAALAAECGKAGVNIASLQVFPQGDRVVDELVLRVPADWRAPDLHELLERAGGEEVVALPSAESSVVDQPARYVRAAREILAQPASFPEVVAHLFDADADADADADSDETGAADETPAAGAVLELVVGDVLVQIRRATPFTTVEYARGEALAALVGDVLGRERPGGTDRRRMGAGTAPVYAAGPDGVSATIDEVPVGRSRVGAGTPAEPTVRPVDLEVDPAWQRRGIGTRLLAETARLARAQGATEIVLTTRADNQAVLPVVLAAGLRGRIRMAGEQLTVRIGLAEVRPLSGSSLLGGP